MKSMCAGRTHFEPMAEHTSTECDVYRLLHMANGEIQENNDDEERKRQQKVVATATVAGNRSALLFIFAKYVNSMNGIGLKLK